MNRIRTRSTPRRLTSPLLATACALAAVSAAQSPALAQSAGRLDEAQFIQGLRQRGMRELLLYYIEKHPPADPIDKQQIVIEQHKLAFDDETAAPAARAASLESAIVAYEQLFTIVPADHPQLPVWRTQFAEYLLRIVIPSGHMNADLFAEFGLTTPEQRKALTRLTAIARRQTDLASEELFTLTGDIPRRADFEQTYVNTGLWQLINEDYAQVQTPYYRARAHHLAHLIDDPDAALAVALNAASRIPTVDLAPEARADVQILTSRMLIALGRFEMAEQALRPLLADDSLDPHHRLVAQLAIAAALHGLKRDPDAMSVLDEAADSDYTASNPLMLVLAFDQRFRITNDYRVYEQLLEHPAAQPHRSALANFVNQRITANPADVAELAKAPALVVLAHVDHLVSEGTEQLAQSRQATDAAAKRQLLASAQKSLAQADQIVASLLTRSDVPADYIGRARFQRGAIRFQAGQTLAAAEAWIDMADQLPDQPQSGAAAVNAFLVAHSLYEKNPNNLETLNLADRAARVMLEKHPDATLPSGQPASIHWHTYGAMLREVGRFEPAIAALQRVTVDHPLHADAAYQIVLCRFDLWAASDPNNDQPRRANELVQAADSAESVLRAAATASPDEADRHPRKLADTLLRKAQVMAESLNAAAQARLLLEDFDARLLEFDDIAAARQQALVAMLVNQFGDVEAARRLILEQADRFPDQAGPMTKAVLDTLNRQITNRRRVDADADPLAATAADLARFLLDWASKRPDIASDPAALRPYEALLGNQLIVAGRYDEAIELFDRLVAQPGGADDLSVLYGRARALFESGDLDLALPAVNVILNRAPDPRAPEVWHCWAMRLSILDTRHDALGENAAAQQKRDLSRQIFSSIAKLELLDGQLGGPPHNERLQFLKNKHFPR